jgi:hypothetical protein
MRLLDPPDKTAHGRVGTKQRMGINLRQFIAVSATLGLPRGSSPEDWVATRDTVREDGERWRPSFGLLVTASPLKLTPMREGGESSSTSA